MVNVKAIGNISAADNDQPAAISPPDHPEPAYKLVGDVFKHLN